MFAIFWLCFTAQARRNLEKKMDINVQEGFALYIKCNWFDVSKENVGANSLADVARCYNPIYLRLRAPKLAVWPDLRQFRSLRELDISRTDFVSLPNSIATLSTVEKLTLRENSRMTRLPPCVAKMTNLKRLDVIRSAFEEIDCIAYLPNLEIIEAAQSAIKEVPVSVERHPSLRFAEFLHCPFAKRLFPGAKSVGISEIKLYFAADAIRLLITTELPLPLYEEIVQHLHFQQI
jgi:hypothetical protein